MPPHAYCRAATLSPGGMLPPPPLKLRTPSAPQFQFRGAPTPGLRSLPEEVVLELEPQLQEARGVQEEALVVQWLDASHTRHHGLSYLMADGSMGVTFNDSTKVRGGGRRGV